ncbi:hypothetical protein HB13667_07680 [Pseudomonas putida]|uniref:DUF1828 domain-containing protein n=1 Tax=Pseudomonas putida TaxID=303 RepID=A0A0N8HGK2_PSEPU|nr:DUF1828 domain-containing protein [Pseudomonas putida]KPM67204.1 hypothetical protein HB13667_07680 [Pseudomonas putida]
MNDIAAIKETLCHAFCEDVAVSARGDLLTVSLPLTARDGDSFTSYLTRSSAGWRISDAANTMMRLSYENDLGKLLTGPRAKLFETILSENGLQEDDGEIFLEVPADRLVRGLFQLGQGLSRVEDIALWSRSRVESTFYHDLREILYSIVPSEMVDESYAPAISGGEDYLIDYQIRTQGRPLYLFGVNGKDKARLTTITLLHLKHMGLKFDSMIVCSDFTELPKQDASRLMTAANDIVPVVTDIQAIKDKILDRVS